MQVGEIWRHESFYADPASGELLPKFLVVLGRTPGGDIVARLLTSRAHGRPEAPPCYHGNPYPGFFLGVLGGPLGAKSWVDLRQLDDLDEVDTEALRREGELTLAGAIPTVLLRPMLECVAGAEDTTRLQARAIRDQLAAFPGS